MSAIAKRVREPVMRKYHVSTEQEWASIVVTDEAPGQGQVMINSTFGNWSYFWGGMGQRCIRSFLVGCDNGYLQSKLLSGRGGVSGVFDETATLAAIKKHIAENFKGAQLKAELKLLNDYDFDDAVARHDWAAQTAIEDPWFLFCSKPEPQSNTFLGILWPAVVALWREELAEEKAGGGQ